MDMKHLEEKILAYLDGSLGATEREEVLREVSASPEGRRMLEEHLRVNSLLTQAAKPTSAPLDAQRELAAKIPMMTTFLPYLAPQPARKAAAVWYRSTKYIAALVGGTAIIGGALWYALSNSNNSGESQNLPSAANTNTLQQNAAKQPASNPTAATDHAAEQNIVTPNSTASNTEHNATANSATAATTTRPHASSDRAGMHHAKSNDMIVAKSSNTLATNHAALAGAVQNTKSEQVKQTSEPLSQNNVAAAAAEPPEQPLHEAAPKDTPHATSPSHSILPNFMLERASSSYIPLRIFANYQSRSSMLPSLTPTQHTIDADSGVFGNSQMTSGFEVGIDYELSPWFSLGLRGGQAYFYSMQPYSYHTYHGDLDLWVSDAYLKREQAYWSGIALRYEINPQDKLRFAASLVGGAAFTTVGLSPLGMAEVSGAYSIFKMLALEAAVSVDGVKVKAEAGSPPVNPQGRPVGYVTRGPSLSTSPVTALGGRIGLVFHP